VRLRFPDQFVSASSTLRPKLVRLSAAIDRRSFIEIPTVFAVGLATFSAQSFAEVNDKFE
jgi:hypothetical protein